MAYNPTERSNQIRAYFESCNRESAAEIAARFTPDAVIWDTNHPPVRGAVEIGLFWDKIRSQWTGAVWAVDSVVVDAEHDTAAIEWHMTGTGDDGPFVFRGSEHYVFEGELIAEIRQYWTFSRDRLDTGLVGYDYA